MRCEGCFRSVDGRQNALVRVRVRTAPLEEHTKRSWVGTSIEVRGNFVIMSNSVADVSILFYYNQLEHPRGLKNLSPHLFGHGITISIRAHSFRTVVGMQWNALRSPCHRSG